MWTCFTASAKAANLENKDFDQRKKMICLKEIREVKQLFSSQFESTMSVK